MYKSFKRFVKGFTAFVIISIVILVLMFFISTDNYLVRPGDAEPLSELITVEGGNNNSKGEFYLTTVNQTRANILIWLYGYFNPYVELVERKDVVPEEMDVEDYREMMDQYMEDSKNMSQTVALKRAGYEIKIESDGVEVVEIPESSPAKGVLKTGDLVKKIDGKEVVLAEEMVEKIRERSPGEIVRLIFERNDQRYEESIQAVESDDDPNSAALEVFIKTSNWSPVFPLEVTIDSKNIGGPSAGLMFALEIKNQLTDYDLTAGERIAGTGTINMEEEVGSVGGVRHKMVAAERAGIRYFLAPKGNSWVAEYVSDYYDDFDAVIVESLDDVLDFLEHLRKDNDDSKLAS